MRVLAPFGYFPQLAWFGVFVAVVTTFAQALALTLGAGLLGVGVVYHCSFAVCASFATSYMRKAMARERLADGESSLAFGIANYARSVALSVKGVLEMLRQEQFRLIVAPMVGPAGLVLFMTSRTMANVLAAGLATITNPLTPELARYLNLRDAAKSASVDDRRVAGPGWSSGASRGSGAVLHRTGLRRLGRAVGYRSTPCCLRSSRLACCSWHSRSRPSPFCTA